MVAKLDGMSYSWILDKWRDTVRSQVLVDYYIIEGTNRSRQTAQLDAVVQLNGATSEFAVQSYLAQKHGKTVEIMNLRWL